MFADIITSPILIWFLIGLALILLEFVIPGFVIIFFGVAAWFVFILVSIFPGMAFWVQLMIFSVLSLGTLIFLRRSLKKKFFSENEGAGSESVDDFIGRTALVEKAISKAKNGKVNFKGASWEAYADQDIPEGVNVTIVGRDSIKLKVVPVK